MTAPTLSSTEKSWTGLRRRFFWLCAAALSLLAAAIGLYEAARYLLAETMPLEPTDAIVVLGGESQERPDRAAALYLRGLAPLVIVSGDGDCRVSAERLRAQGVDPGSILLECLSGNTAENAAFSVRMLRAVGAHSVIVVTSWWHTKRALRCFAQAAPGMKVLVAWSHPPTPFQYAASREEWSHLLQEYLKTIWYRLPIGRRCAANVEGA